MELCKYINYIVVMTSSAEIWIVNKIAEVAERCGVSPIDAEICFSYVNAPEQGDPHYVMGLVDNTMAVSEDQASKIHKVCSLLGMDGGGRRFDDLWEAEEVINQALSLAPRARIR